MTYFLQFELKNKIIINTLQLYRCYHYMLIFKPAHLYYLNNIIFDNHQNKSNGHSLLLCPEELDARNFENVLKNERTTNYVIVIISFYHFPFLNLSMSI